jgi:plastocyanin
MTQDPTCSKLHPSGATDEEVVTGSNGTLANVVVYVAAGLGDGSSAATKGPAVIDQKGCMYHPRVLALQVNQKLHVFNRDATTHNIHPMPKNNREWNKSQPPGSAPLEETFAREEIAIPVKCNVHPWMKGSIAVFKHPYFAITGKDGRFAIQNLPPGSYTLTAWHEKFGTTTQKVTITANETKTMDFVFKAQASKSPAGLSPPPGL